MKPYFISAFWDFIFVGGGSLLLFAFLVFSPLPLNRESLYTASVILAWIGNWPHFASTLYRVYSNPNAVVTNPGSALLAPVAVIIAAFSSFAFPALGAPVFVKLYLLWSPYHYSGQSLGISLLYARRSGIVVHRFERFALSTFAFGCFFSLVTRFESQRLLTSFLGVSLPTLPISPLFFDLSKVILVLSGVGVVITAVRWKMRWIIFVPLLGQFAWTFASPAPGFVQFIPFFHSLQYLLIVGFMNLATQVPDTKKQLSLKTFHWMKMNFVLGVFLFWGVPILLSSTGTQYTLAKVVVWASINIHHFIIDGLIWKLRNPAVSRPLTLSLKDLVLPATAKA